MLQNQMLSAIASTLRAFDPISDTLDILIISFAFYQLIQFARKSRAGQLVKGILLIVVFYGLAYVLNLRTVTWVLNNVLTIGFTAACGDLPAGTAPYPGTHGPDHGLGGTAVRQSPGRPVTARRLAKRGGGHL